MQAEFQQVPVGDLRESRANPRQHLSAAGEAELLASVQEHGVLVPLLVRPVGKGGKLEVVAGARRLRAAKAAGCATVPVRVVELDAKAALEVAVIENLQREDVHPLDEAQGYRALMERAGYDVAELVRRLGKGETYIYQRLKLNDLIEPARKMFNDDKIGLGHALLLARVQPNDQQAILTKGPYSWGHREVTLGDLAHYIDREILRRLKGAPFKASDTELLPAAGSCEACPKRTGSAPQLFPEIQAKDTCTDGACYERKVEAHLSRQVAEYAERGEELLRVKRGYVCPWKPKNGVIETFSTVDPKKPCDHARAAIVVAGDGVGAVILICTNTKCGAGLPRSTYRRSPKELAEAKAQRERELQKQETERRARQLLIEGLPNENCRHRSAEMRLIGAALIARAESDDAKQLCRERGVEVTKGPYAQRDYRKALAKHVDGLSGQQAAVVLADLALVVFCSRWDGESRRFNEIAAERGVDVKAIAKQVAAEAAAAEKAKEEKKAAREERRKTKPAGKRKAAGRKGRG